MDEYKDDEKKQESEHNDEKIFYANGKYYTMEEFFNPEEEPEPEPRKNSTKWLKIFSFIIAIALIANVFALWPKLYNSASIQFLKISHELSKNENIQQYKKSVVIINAGDKKGTGFYFSKDGLIMTNDHVISDEDKINVSFHDGKRYDAKVLHNDSQMDIAILKIDTKGINYPVLTFERRWEEDQPIYIIGNPIFYNFIANKGHIKGLIPGKKTAYMVIDAPVFKGNSGSPVINYDGKVVGVVFATTTINIEEKSMKVGLAVPISYVLNTFNYIINQ